MAQNQMDEGMPECSAAPSIIAIFLCRGSPGRQEAIETVNHLCIALEALIDCPGLLCCC